MPDGSFLDSRRSRFRAAMLLAMVADAVQIILFPLFGEGALSPLDDVLDLIVAVALVRLIGWHWEFAPSLIAELVPGVDLIPGHRHWIAAPDSWRADPVAGVVPGGGGQHRMRLG